MEESGPVPLFFWKAPMEKETKPTELSVRCSRLLWTDTESGYMMAEYLDLGGRRIIASGNAIPHAENLSVKLYGKWGKTKNGEDRFYVQQSELLPQVSREGMVAFLTNADRDCTPYLASRIFDVFGKDTWHMLLTAPYKLMEADFIDSALASKLIESARREMCSEKLEKLLSKAGVKNCAYYVRRIIAQFHGDPYGAVTADPYILMDIGISFRQADVVAEMLGIGGYSDSRLNAMILYLLRQNEASGNTCCSMDRLVDMMLRTDSGLEKGNCSAAVEKAVVSGRIYCLQGMFYSPNSYFDESGLACELKRLLSAETMVPDVSPIIDDYESTEGIKLAAMQRKAIQTAFENSICIVSGSAGTGKTTTVRGMLFVCDRLLGSSARVQLIAPTGKAAKRLSAATGYPACTIHHAIGYTEDGMVHDRSMLDADLIVVDESSMMDQYIARELLCKVPQDAHLVICGDPYQLPSVSCGNVLHDLIQSGVIPTVKLSVIYRQSEESIVKANAEAILAGDISKIRFDKKDFRFIRIDDPEKLLDTGAKLYRMYAAEDPDDVILLTPQRRNTSVGVNEYNHAIQEGLNPPRPGENEIRIGSTVYRPGDRVMNLKNTEKVFNGETGIIRKIRPKPGTGQKEAVIIFGTREVVMDTSTMAGCLDLAYASTVHKAQGEEYETVIIILTTEHKALLQRSVLYTAVSRSRRRVIMLGQPEALYKAVATKGRDTRITGLKNQLIS